MAMTPSERLEAVFAEADGRRRASGLPEPSIEEVMACCEQGGEGIQGRLASWDGVRYQPPECDWGEPVGEEMWFMLAPAEARAEGEQRCARLVAALLEADRLDDLKRMTKDKAYYEQLCTEFGL